MVSLTIFKRNKSYKCYPRNASCDSHRFVTIIVRLWLPGIRERIANAHGRFQIENITQLKIPIVIEWLRGHIHYLGPRGIGWIVIQVCSTTGNLKKSKKCYNTVECHVQVILPYTGPFQ